MKKKRLFYMYKVVLIHPSNFYFGWYWVGLTELQCSKLCIDLTFLLTLYALTDERKQGLLNVSQENMAAKVQCLPKGSGTFVWLPFYPLLKGALR